MNRKMAYDPEYFRGKTAVVTGAASGIGLALVEELLQCGAAKVVMSDINRERLTEHEKRLQALYNDKVKGMLCNVTLEEDVKNLIQGSAEFFGGKIDLLFNNAGALFTGWFDEVTNDKWKAAFDLNFYGALYGMRAVLPIMKEQGGGQIINVISGTAFAPMAEWSPYATTKAALNMLTMTVRAEYWDDNIKISAATPGTTATNIFGDKKLDQGSMQTPRQSACRILRGAQQNDRIIFGDDPDLRGAKNCFAYGAQKRKDAYQLRVARERRKGINAI